MTGNGLYFDMAYYSPDIQEENTGTSDFGRSYMLGYRLVLLLLFLLSLFGFVCLFVVVGFCFVILAFRHWYVSLTRDNDVLNYL